MGNATNSIWNEIWALKRAVGTFTGADTQVSRLLPPRNLAVRGGFKSLHITWENQKYTSLPHTEIFLSETENIEDGRSIVTVMSNSYSIFDLDVIRPYWVWARGVDLTSWKYSDWAGPVSAITNGLEEEDFLVGEIAESALAPFLAEKINYAGLVGLELKDVNLMLEDLDLKLEDHVVDLTDMYQYVINEFNTLSTSIVDYLENTSELYTTITNAGIITDPETGTVQIFGLEAYKTENDARLSNVELNIDAVESTLTSKVTLAQVDERIAGAVFGDAGELLMSGVDARIAVVEETLDGVEAELLEKATYVETDALGGRIGTAETRLDGMDAEIDLLATSTELDAVEERVTTAELNIDALEGIITQTVAATVDLTQDEEEILADGLVDAMLNDREGNADATEKAYSAIAVAKTDLYAHIDDGLEAEAGERTLLAAQVAGNTGAIKSESVVRANADYALSSDITRVSAKADTKNKTYRQTSAPTTGMSTGDLWFDSDDNNKAYRYNGSSWVATEDTRIAQNKADIQTEREARADAESALASTISIVAATANAKNKTYRQASAPTTGMVSGDLWFDSDNNNKAYRYNGSSWVATDDKRIEGNTAAIQTEREARADAESALASTISTVSAKADTKNKTYRQTSAPTTGMAEGDLWFDSDDNNKAYRYNGSSWVATDDARIAQNKADIIEEREARADTDSALARFSRNIQAVVEPVAEGLVEDVLNQADARKNAVQQYAVIQQDYNVKIEDGLFSEATARELLATRLGANEAAIQIEKKERADADSAEAGLREQLAVRVGTSEAHILENADAIADVDGNVRAQWTLKTQAIGAKTAVAGIGLFADGETGISEFTVLADNFFVYNPATAAPKKVFQIVNNQALMNGDILATGTVQGEKLAATSTIQLASGGKLLIGTNGSMQIGQRVYMDDTRATFVLGSFQIVDTLDGTITIPFEKRADGKIYLKNVIADKASISDATLTNAAIGNATITNAMIANAAITEAKIDELAVKTANIDNLAVTTLKLAELAVTEAKIADAAITSAKIGTAAIESAHIAEAAIESAHINDLTVDTIHIKNNAITAYAFINGGRSSNWHDLYGNVSRWYPVPINPKLAITEILSGKPTMVTLAVNWYSSEAYGGTLFRVIASKTNYAITNNYKTTSVIDTLINSGTTIFNKNCGAVGESTASYTEQFQWNPASDGTWYLYVLWQPAAGGDPDSKWGIYMNSHSVSVIHMKR